MKTPEEILDDFGIILRFEIIRRDVIRAMELYSAQSKWLNVKFKLPKSDGYYLVWHVAKRHGKMQGRIFIAFWKKNQFVLGDKNPLQVEWYQPLPEPPKS